MLLDKNTKEKPKIEYPCEWGFKIIGTDKEKLKECISDIMGEKEHKCKDGNISKNGKFVSMNASCQVDSQEERDEIFKSFRDHKDVKMVI
jgi:putative lipoic acid-binding regulatory protein